MIMDEELERTVAWLETWVEEHATSRAAGRITQLLNAFKAMDGSTVPIEGGIPLRDTAERYVHLKSDVLSRVPQGSIWAALHDGDVRLENFVLHLYHSHTLGCVDCFGGDHH